VTPPTTNPFKAPSAPKKAVAKNTPKVSALKVDQASDLTGGGDTASVTFKSENANHRREFGWLNLKDLVVDPAIQRPEVPSEVNKIARDFFWPALGTAVASARFDPETNDYTYVVLDGQQRRAGALKAEDKWAEVGYDGLIRVDVHYGLTPADEARLFRVLNERKSVQPIVLFRTALVEQDPAAIAVQNILDGLGIPFGTAKGYSGAKSALRLVSRRNGVTVLTWALTQVQKIYDENGDGGCYDATVVEAFFWLYDHHGIRIDEDQLYAKLASHGGGVEGLVGDARTIKNFRGGRMMVNLIRAIIARYNKGLRSERTRLPDWTLTSTGAEAPVDTAGADE
jgi:hypothetical protein